jgi:diguanylate cyclase (GGDEF)-like protein
MIHHKKPAWLERELYDLLCFLIMGLCFWMIGRELDLFVRLGALATRYGLTDLVMLGFCMSFGLYGATHRKSHLLRQAIRERDHAQVEAEAVARHDTMTGLANRRYFNELLKRQLAEPGLTTVILIDLDKFKAVNDLHGHAAGDAVLCSISDRLRALLPPGSIAARLGGDEFAAVVDLGGDPETVGRLCKLIIAELVKPVAWGNSRLEVGATIGIAMRSDEDVGSEALLHAADIAMYEAKKEGRGTYRFFRKEMDLTLKARAQLELELRTAIDEGQIQPFYQPLISLVDKELTGFEVLARWRHPTRGLLPPDLFIGVAEETGMIAELCWSLTRQACLDAKSWPGHLQLAVNISPQQLQDRQLPERILEILTATDFAPSRLEVEITETALVADLEAARHALTSLQNLGVRIALDDFGTGYSSLYHLRELKFDKLKIDRSYIGTLTQGDERAKLVDAIISLGSSLGMVTTAEGIESVGSSDWLAGQGCTYGQGYFFGRPMPKAEIDRWVKNRELSPPSMDSVAA